ncbi:hypothetical protein L202_03043 [Cryptococcus amylolentus CBS 6039]|uniref:Uncharacterized protein n=1 Tax=Cryptococcus amylolentus CBS 6039 TaxID=1295533 RepID=A0A1E3HXA6_9TREE|nr:hypothetical protein L202_03043 [Cryptococcus amylolentus CBS 6039]ODN80919.1 hypothetical protein L202_03043 [Cryptococcus amylolentus CBS 6039]
MPSSPTFSVSQPIYASSAVDLEFSIGSMIDRGRLSDVYSLTSRVPANHPDDLPPLVVKTKPIDPKIPIAEAIKLAGHGKILGECAKRPGKRGRLSGRRYCRTLLSALQWAADPSRGDVKVLALMGSGYFSNGMALNNIEHASSPGQETWDNICAIDDIVSFLCSDTSNEKPASIQGQGKALSERGIVPVASVR